MICLQALLKKSARFAASSTARRRAADDTGEYRARGYQNRRQHRDERRVSDRGLYDGRQLFRRCHGGEPARSSLGTLQAARRSILSARWRQTAASAVTSSPPHRRHGHDRLAEARGQRGLGQDQDPAPLLRYIVEKGSIAIDGVSLTVAAVTDTDFSVSIIPHTGAQTILLAKSRRPVNLECDVIGKYVEKLTAPHKTGGISTNFLAENGFL